MPDAVTVYAQLNESLLVAYRAGDCVLTVVKLPRDQLLRLLREELGEPV